MLHSDHPKQSRFLTPFVIFPLFTLLTLVLLYAAGYFIGLSRYHSLTRDEHALDADGRDSRCVSQQEMLRNTHKVAAGTLKRLKEDRDELKKKLKLLEEGKGRTGEPAASCGGKDATSNNGEGPSVNDGGGNMTGSAAVSLQRAANLIDSLTHQTESWLKKAADTTPSLAACNKSPRRYSVVFDAGSTGSRVHVYRYNLTSNPYDNIDSAPNGAHASLLPYLKLEDELFIENHEPLSGFSDPRGAAASLVPLLDAAKARVPTDMHACVGIELKATAGLRRIGAEQAGRVLDAVRREFQKGPFWVHSELGSVRILEGREEGPLAWLTVNFLIGSLSGTKETATILDLGGGSTQVVMRPNDPEVLEGHEEFTDTFAINGKSIKLYQHSYEGNGLNAAREQLLASVATSVATGGTTTAAKSGPLRAFPCFPQGYAHEKSGVSNGVGGGGVTPSMEECVALFRKHVVRSGGECSSKSCGFNGVFQPDVRTAVSGPVYAFSFYHDLLRPHMTAGTTVIRLQDIIGIASQVCKSMKSVEQLRRENKGKVSVHPSLRPELECLHLSYVVALLRDGFHYPLDQELHIAKKIDGYETAWTLGASLVSLEEHCV
ncbi:nucleoside phosphatase, putative [Trypanosoma brucei brucei TREU927]|uniref:Nucleoside phosphatase, putative n=2 Tax=Trypanosoma brucei TaxID=5691 RepID=D6XLB5_TRYB2|nr:nucleoside phosphatase, putative [Trypanosoma brucei brucei TREU927]AAX78953.1 nucleoside phosphatase, putative [Trypanosoma brucei]AAZ13145.1 nucleoside phosphatase, putative [Trypanosoma brucei brucei TREU927]DAA04951.1 TPA_exp: putative NTPDase [Trypanosoma brucei]